MKQKEKNQTKIIETHTNTTDRDHSGGRRNDNRPEENTSATVRLT